MALLPDSSHHGRGRIVKWGVDSVLTSPDALFDMEEDVVSHMEPEDQDE